MPVRHFSWETLTLAARLGDKFFPNRHSRINWINIQKDGKYVKCWGSSTGRVMIEKGGMVSFDRGHIKLLENKPKFTKMPILSLALYEAGVPRSVLKVHNNSVVIPDGFQEWVLGRELAHSPATDPRTDFLEIVAGDIVLVGKVIQRSDMYVGASGGFVDYREVAVRPYVAMEEAATLLRKHFFNL
jgi:hypothetical protein